MRIYLPLSVVLGVAAGLLAHRFLPVGSIWIGVIVGVTAGIVIFCVVLVIRSKGKTSS
jgi:hypothetical protein